MLFLLDTNALSDAVRENPVLQSRIARQSQTDQVATCVIAWGELCFGAERLALGKKRMELEAKIQEIGSRIRCLGVLASAANHYAQFKRDAERRGRSLDGNDLWIAATAAAFNAVLVTRDVDFTGITGIQIEDWTKP